MEPLVAALRAGEPGAAASELTLLSRACGPPDRLNCCATTPSPRPSLGVGADRLDEVVDLVAVDTAGRRHWFTMIGVTPHEARYEQLTADLTGTTDEILDFLGLQRGGVGELGPATIGQADDLDADCTARCRAR